MSGCRRDRTKDVADMFVKGTQEEIEWLLAELANGCTGCPYMDECNKLAAQEAGKRGGTMLTCSSYLRQKITCEVIGDNHNI